MDDGAQSKRSWALAVVLVALAGPAAAAEFVVDSLVDGIDLDQGDGICLGLADRCTLRAAIQEANALPGTHTIVLGAGVYALTIRGSDEDAGATGDLDVTGALRIEGVGADETVVEASTGDRVFDVAAGAELTLAGMTVCRGLAIGAGGGLRAGEDTFVFLSRSRIELNIATELGGGVALVATEHPATLLAFETDFFQNVAGYPAPVSGTGGAIYAGFGSVQLLDVTLAANEADSSPALWAGGQAVIERSTIRDHSANRSTMEFLGSAPSRIENSTISGNDSDFAILLTTGAGRTTIRNSTIVDNEAAITLDNFASPRLFLGNSVIFNTVTAGECQDVDSLGHNARPASPEGYCGTPTTDLLLTDPELGPLQDNGGDTPTHLPLAGSPLIDAGDDESCLGVDQRLADRPQDGDGDGAARCDIGAVEVPEPGRPQAGVAALIALGLRARAARRRPRQPTPRHQAIAACRSR